MVKQELSTADMSETVSVVSSPTPLSANNEPRVTKNAQKKLFKVGNLRASEQSVSACLAAVLHRKRAWLIFIPLYVPEVLSESVEIVQVVRDVGRLQ